MRPSQHPYAPGSSYRDTLCSRIAIQSEELCSIRPFEVLKKDFVVNHVPCQLRKLTGGDPVVS